MQLRFVKFCMTLFKSDFWPWVKQKNNSHIKFRAVLDIFQPRCGHSSPPLQMHSSYCIYEGESTKNYVSEVKNFLRRFKTPYYFNVKHFLNFGAPSMFKCKIGAQF